MRLAVTVAGIAVLGSAGCGSEPSFDVVSFHDAEVTRDDGRVVRVQVDDYHSPSCWVPDPEVDYQPDAVVITARYRRVEEYCSLEGALLSTPFVVHLTEPIGDRAVVDGST